MAANILDIKALPAALRPLAEAAGIVVPNARFEA
jgi:hypothetical protein